MDKRQDKTLQRHVLAAFRMTYQSNRNFLAGIARYLKRNPQWQVTVTDNFTNFDSDSLAEAERNGFDGIITVCPKGAVAESAIIESRLPVAILGAGSGDCLARTRGIVFIREKTRPLASLRRGISCRLVVSARMRSSILAYPLHGLQIDFGGLPECFGSTTMPSYASHPILQLVRRRT